MPHNSTQPLYLRFASLENRMTAAVAPSTPARPAAGRYPLNWNLDALFPNPQTAEFKTLLSGFSTELQTLAADADTLPAITAAGASGTWGAYLERLAAVLGRFEDLSAFVGCHSADQAENKEFQRVEGLLSALWPLRSKVLTTVELAFVGVPADKVKIFIDGDPRLKAVAFFLEEAGRNATFRLPREQEQLLSELSVDGLSAWSRLYDRISGELRIEVMEKGNVVRKSVGQIQYDMPERSVRQNNFYAADKAWGTLGDTCADALNHISGARLTKYKRLKVQDHLDAPLRLNRMTRGTLDTMWGTITDRKKMLLPYLERKAKLLGLEKLSWYDQIAPLPPGIAGNESELTYDQACDLVIRTFTEFSPDFGEFARMAIETGWTEAENRPGKKQGAFCTGIPTKKETRVFMTYTGTADSMSTLAHELGHAYHSYVLRNEPLLLQDYPMNLAETASTFAEAVLNEQRLVEAKSTGARLALLDNLLADSVAFLMNIHARFLFEDRFHKERPQGELTTARLSELMQEAQKEAYLGAFADDGWYPGFWISKLHFYIGGWPFYNFPYTFGYLLSQGLYAVAATDKTNFPARYREFLIATGNRQTEDALQQTLGYDLTKPEFWNRSLDVIETRVKAFCDLADSLGM
ncbi:Oligoendopeptidase F, plasmid [Planctomyces sp. SH-PL14]|nr:Oligoendopeptidase F, plasmid [Planctomyces sp. SH-PL14]